MIQKLSIYSSKKSGSLVRGVQLETNTETENAGLVAGLEQHIHLELLKRSDGFNAGSATFWFSLGKSGLSGKCWCWKLRDTQ